MPTQLFFGAIAGGGSRLIERPDRGCPLEPIGTSAGEQLVEHDAEGIQVAAGIDRIAAQEFRTGVVRAGPAAAVRLGPLRWRVRRTDNYAGRSSPASSMMTSAGRPARAAASRMAVPLSAS